MLRSTARSTGTESESFVRRTSTVTWCSVAASSARAAACCGFEPSDSAATDIVLSSAPAPCCCLSLLSTFSSAQSDKSTNVSTSACASTLLTTHVSFVARLPVFTSVDCDTPTSRKCASAREMMLATVPPCTALHTA